MLHHCVLAFTAGREALGQWGGAHGLSWESGGNEEEYFRSILSALCMQRRKLCHICCPSYERLVHLPDWPFVCTFSPESRGLMLKFFPLPPIVNPGSSVCALSASTCPTSTAPCKPAPPARAMGQGATSREAPEAWRARQGHRCYSVTIPSCLGSRYVAFPWGQSMCQSSSACAGGCLGFHKGYLILVQPTLMATRRLGVFALQGARWMNDQRD